VLLGVLLAQGLFYGLRHLLTGALLAVTGAPGAAEARASSEGEMLLQAAQVLALLVGGGLAGAGRRGSFFLGAVVGGFNGVIAAGVPQAQAPALAPLPLLAQPFLHAGLAALGGWLGALIWRPLPAPIDGRLADPARKRARRRSMALFAGRVSWFRVLLGAAIAIAGAAASKGLFEKILDLGGGKLGTETVLQDRIITWEIKAVALLLGGALAGATTANGIKQGLFVGFFSSFLLVGIETYNTPYWAEVAASTFASAFSLTLVGGWFGGALFPPVTRRQRSRDIPSPPA
jgi:hypothetical protein